jgi:AcrR family transcriptional regulator
MASTRTERKAETRAKVIAAAQGLFATHGFEAVTVRAVAKAAGMSTGAVFASVRDKVELYEVAMGSPLIDVRAFLGDVMREGGPIAVEAVKLRAQLFGVGA